MGMTRYWTGYNFHSTEEEPTPHADQILLEARAYTAIRKTAEVALAHSELGESLPAMAYDRVPTWLIMDLATERNAPDGS